jgi:predicted O-methyltransferase YrrM
VTEHQADIDVRLLRSKHPNFAPSDADWIHDLDRIVDLWRTYVTSISAHDMAASPGTVAYLYRLCDHLKPARILDLGSGLSSALFRKWAGEREAVCEIVSVDDSEEWIGRTRDFLRFTGLPETGVHLWPIDIEPESFDLVFHDFAGGPERNRVAEIAAKAVKPGGCVVFDDAHFEEHLLAFERVSAENGITLYSLAKWTFDAIGRYSLLGFKDKEPTAVHPSITLAESYAQLCQTPSDINEHLPRLAWMAENLDVKHIIELGARTGVSTTAWLYGLQGKSGRLTTVDMSPAPDIGAHANWRHVQGDDTDPAVMGQVGGMCDILFIDTSHAYEHTLWELRNWGQKVRSGGLIVCHDTELQRPFDPPCPPTDPDFPVRSAIEVFCAETGNRWTNIPGCWGLGIIEVR